MMKTSIVIGSVALLLGACGERPQNMAAGKKPGEPNWQGADDAFVVPGWKVGDREAWEAQLKARAQTQNEYLRTGGKS